MEMNDGERLEMTYPVTLRDDESFRDAFHANGIELIQDLKQQGYTPKEIARSLLKIRNLDAKMIGIILGEPDSFFLNILQEYANGFPFKDFSCDVALRAFLGRFILPGEAQKIDRILQAFAKSFFSVNGHENDKNGVYISEDIVYTLAFSIVLLNTDAHTPHLARRHKMKKEDFIRNFQRCCSSFSSSSSSSSSSSDEEKEKEKEEEKEEEKEKQKTKNKKQIVPTGNYLGDFFDSFTNFPLELIQKKKETLFQKKKKHYLIEIEFQELRLGVEIETSIDGRTCLVKKMIDTKYQQLEGWVIVAVGNDCTRTIGYPLTRYLLKTADRPVTISFCEPSVYFSSLGE